MRTSCWLLSKTSNGKTPPRSLAFIGSKWSLLRMRQVTALYCYPELQKKLIIVNIKINHWKSIIRWNERLQRKIENERFVLDTTFLADLDVLTLDTVPFVSMYHHDPHHHHHHHMGSTSLLERGLPTTKAACTVS